MGFLEDREALVQAEFGTQLKWYMSAFGLDENDIAQLCNSNSKNVIDIVTGKSGVGIKKAERIANVFGRTYYQFGNPEYDLPSYEELPPKTQNQILRRREIGFPNRDEESKFSTKLDTVIYKTKTLHKPVTAKEILNAFAKADQKLYDTGWINIFLGKEPRSRDIIKLDQKRDGLTQYVLKGADNDS